MRKYREDIVAVLLSLSSMAVVIFVGVYLINLQPYAKKAEVDAVKAAAVTALINTHAEQKVQDQASAVVSTMSKTHTVQLKSADERIKKLEGDYAVLKNRVDILDGTATRARR